MKHFKINFVQNTATGVDQSAETVVSVIRWAGIGTGDIMATTNIKRDFAGVPACAYEVVATVTVRHPAIMAGTWDELEGVFFFFLLRMLKNAGCVEESEWGVNFWVA